MSNYAVSIISKNIQIRIKMKFDFDNLKRFNNKKLIFSRVVIPLCGGNIDTTVLGRVIERGLAVDGRLCRFVVTVTDRPGGIAELTKLICHLGVR